MYIKGVYVPSGAVPITILIPIIIAYTQFRKKAACILRKITPSVRAKIEILKTKSLISIEIGANSFLPIIKIQLYFPYIKC